MGSTLEHLLAIEAEAAALVTDAQTEANRRIRENEETNRSVYEQRIKKEILLRETDLKQEKEKITALYINELDNYRKEISGINVDEQKFFFLFNKYLEEG